MKQDGGRFAEAGWERKQFMIKIEETSDFMKASEGLGCYKGIQPKYL